MTSISPLAPGHWHNGPIFRNGKEIANPITEHAKRIKNDEAKAKKLEDRVLSCPPVKALYDLANQVKHPRTGKIGPWKIAFLKNCGISKQDPNFTVWEDRKNNRFEGPAESPATCYPQGRTIFISEDCSDNDALSAYIFELTNAIHQEKFFSLREEAVKGKIDCEEFVYKTEFIEFEGSLIHHVAVEKAIENYNWDQSIDIFPNNDVQTFINFYEDEIKFTPHCDNYRRMWEKLSGKKSEILAQKADPQKK